MTLNVANMIADSKVRSRTYFYNDAYDIAFIIPNFTVSFVAFETKNTVAHYTVSVDDLEPNPNDDDLYSYPCRCGQSLSIAGALIEDGVELFPCQWCSLVYRVDMGADSD
jgi:hypothetical protein